MIQHLSVGKTAHFFAFKRRLSNAAIDDLFRQLRSRTTSPSQNLLRHDREEFQDARWSAISFFHERNPAFFSVPPATKERVCGFLLIVEYSQHIAVFKAGLELPSAFKTRYLQRVPTTRVEAAIAHADAIFEKIRLRNMSPSRLVLRSKTLEAADLQNAIGMSGASRFAPQSYNVRRGDGQHSATPTTGRISHRSERSGYQELIQWACAVIDELAQPPGEIAPFIRNFARPIDLASVASTLKPVSFAVSVSSLSEAILEDPDIRLVRELAEGFVELEENEVAELMDRLDTVFLVSKWRGNLRIVTRIEREGVGKIDIGENRISLRRFDLPDVSPIYVESVGWPLGEAPDRTPLRRYIDRDDHFVVLFQDPTLAYIDGSLYRDELLADGGGNFLRHIQTEATLANATSEKGTFTANQAAFEGTSVFGIIANSIAANDQVLICDDLGDEWADFMG